LELVFSKYIALDITQVTEIRRTFCTIYNTHVEFRKNKSPSTNLFIEEKNRDEKKR